MWEYRCRATEFPVNGTWAPVSNVLCNPEKNNCPVGSFCKAPFKDFPSFTWDKEEINIVEFNYGMTGFDNIFVGMLTVF